MKKLNRKESQVSRDFKATLKNVKRSSQHENKNILNDDSEIFSDSFLNGSRKSNTLERVNYDETICDWKSVNSITIRNVNDILNPPMSLGNQNAETNKNETVLQPKMYREDLKSNSNDRHSEKRTNRESKNKTSNNFFFDRVFSNASEIPFEGTDISNLPFILLINKENKEYLKISVYKYFTVEKTLKKIATKISLNFQEIALYHKKTRLESHITLSWYNINSNFPIDMQLLSKHRYFGSYMNGNYPISIYTSEKIIEIKLLFSKEIKENPDLLELKYKEIFLNNCKQFFLYHIPEDSTIEIIKKRPESNSNSSEYGKSPGFEVSQNFQALTNNLKQCNCNKIRIDAITCGFLSIYDKTNTNHKCLELIDEFGSNMHIKSCIKNKKRSEKDEIDSVASCEEISLHEFIDTEIEIIQKNCKNPITTTDLDYLRYAKNFRAFKQFLRDKIGTKCTNASLAMLYFYAKSLVDFLNSQHESDEKVNQMLDYIRLYFLKYFEKPIIAKGGLANFTPTKHNFIN